MKDDVREMKAEWPRPPDSRINQIAENEDWPEEAAVLPAPNHRRVTGEDLSNLSKIVGEKPGVTDCREGDQTC
jgi:hypothetical protein